MSTRAVITFKDEFGSFSVYQHMDGYPTHAGDSAAGVLGMLRETLAGGYAWQWPRFEADEFAAAYIAQNKGEGGGNIRLSKGHTAHGDLAYSYRVEALHTLDGKRLKVWIYGHTDEGKRKLIEVCFVN